MGVEQFFEFLSDPLVVAFIGGLLAACLYFVILHAPMGKGAGNGR